MMSVNFPQTLKIVTEKLIKQLGWLKNIPR